MLSADIEIVEKYLVSREYNEAVTPAWLRIKAALAESTNSSHNSAMVQCPECGRDAVPICDVCLGKLLSAFIKRAQHQ